MDGWIMPQWTRHVIGIGKIWMDGWSKILNFAWTTSMDISFTNFFWNILGKSVFLWKNSFILNYLYTLKQLPIALKFWQRIHPIKLKYMFEQTIQNVNELVSILYPKIRFAGSCKTWPLFQCIDMLFNWSKGVFSEKIFLFIKYKCKYDNQGDSTKYQKLSNAC